jgi:hypothetical protein
MRIWGRSAPPQSATVRETQVLIDGGRESAFSLIIEPEAMQYDFPPHERVLLTFRGPDRLQQFEMTHLPDAVVIWRPADTEVWASVADGTVEQIGGFANNPAPWMDSGHAAEGPAPWSWPPQR